PAFFTGEGLMAPTWHAPGTVTTTYEGILEIESQKLRLVLHLYKSPDGQNTAALDSPDQNTSGLAVDVVSLRDGALHFEIKVIGASYNGKAKSDGTEFDGEFKQGSIAVPLVLKKK